LSFISLGKYKIICVKFYFTKCMKTFNLNFNLLRNCLQYFFFSSFSAKYIFNFDYISSLFIEMAFDYDSRLTLNVYF
jgi:hypothetical protein